MRFFTRMICLTAIAAGSMAATAPEADAQYPVYSVPIQPVAPAVVGYSAQRRGLFGRRVVVRPVVAPVAAVAPVAVARPVVAAPVTSYYAPPVAVARPVVAAPVTSYYAPPVPVAVPVAVPVRTYYRAPIRTYYRAPVWGF